VIKLDFISSVKQAVEIVKLNGKVAENVSKDKNATLMGILIIAIGSILASVASSIVLGNLNLSLIIFAPIISIIVYFIGIGVMHLLARLLGGKANYMEYFRAQSYSSVLSWLGILALIPLLGGIINFVVSIWGIVVSVVILENVHKLTRLKAIIVVVVPFLVLVLLVAFGALAYFGALSPDTFLPATP
jgi:hypothetical protein